jgi:hypothetical protein
MDHWRGTHNPSVIPLTIRKQSKGSVCCLERWRRHARTSRSPFIAIFRFIIFALTFPWLCFHRRQWLLWKVLYIVMCWMLFLWVIARKVQQLAKSFSVNDYFSATMARDKRQ